MSLSETKEINKKIYRINFYPEERVELFSSLTPPEQNRVVNGVSKHILKNILSKLPEDKLVSLVEYLDPDEATDLLQAIAKPRQEIIIKRLNEDVRANVTKLLEFDPKTAAGLMNLDYVQAETDESVLQVAKKFKNHEKRTGRLPAIIALENGKFTGYLPGHELAFAKSDETIKKHIKQLPYINKSSTHEDVINLFKNHPHNKAVVIDEKENVMGIIYSDDVMRLMHEQESATLYDFAGIHGEESVFDSTPTKVKFRYKWLVLNLGTAFLASFTVSLFNDTISRYVLLAVYMPIVAGMGGNAATQTLAVLVRGITLRQIELKTAFRAVKNELGAAFFSGIINGVIAGTAVFILNGDIRLSIILGIAMIVNLLVAAFFGTIVPLIMHRLGKDPASSATIFITTATDVLGFLTFLGLATLIL